MRARFTGQLPLSASAPPRSLVLDAPSSECYLSGLFTLRNLFGSMPRFLRFLSAVTLGLLLSLQADGFHTLHEALEEPARTSHGAACCTSTHDQFHLKGPCTCPDPCHSDAGRQPSACSHCAPGTALQSSVSRPDLFLPEWSRRSPRDVEQLVPPNPNALSLAARAPPAVVQATAL